MQIIKPLRIGCMTRPIADRPRSRLALTGLICFDLLDPDVLHTEPDMWQTILPEVGEQGALDQWMPKRRGEVLLWGSAAAPGGVAVTQMEIGLRVGDQIRKTLRVHGDRHWQPTLLSAQTSEPEPFATMPLTYERAFGGSDYVGNPVGRGHGVNRLLPTGATVRLPNLEYHDTPVLHPNHEPVPACFMPVNIAWPGHGPGGTYDDAWRKYRYPAMPNDFDRGAYNLAPLDQRISGYFRGNESIELMGMHPEHPLIQSRVPALAMRFFVRREVGETLEEFPAVLDSLCLFPSALRGVLLYRSEVELRQNCEAQEIASLMFACERQGEARPREHYEEVFRLRSGEDAALYALSDFQLMPPFSEADRQRLEKRREEVRQERADLREKKDQCFAAYAAAAVGFALPDGFFKHDGDADLDTMQIPIITDLDHELGNVDLASIKYAGDQLSSKVMAKADVLRQDAKQKIAQADLQVDAIRQAQRTGDYQPVLALFPPAPQQDTGQPGPRMVGILRAVVARVEAEPDWPLAQASRELVKPFQLESIDRALKQDHPALLAERHQLLEAREALLQDIGGSTKADDTPEARSLFVATLRKIAAALAGESDPDADPDTMQSETDRFLQSIGLADLAKGAQPTSDAWPKPDALLSKLADALCNAPPDQVGDVLVAALSALPIAGAMDWLPLKAAMQQAAQIQPDLLKKIGKALDQPPDPQQVGQQLAAAFNFEQATELLSEITDATQREVALVQLRQAQESVAKRIATVAPSFVADDKVDLEGFLKHMGVGHVPLVPQGAFSPPVTAEPQDQQNLRRASALAKGEPGINRLGPDLPPETQEEVRARELLDKVLNHGDLEATARSNSLSSEFLQAHQDVMKEEGALTPKAQQRLADWMLDHAQKQPAPQLDSPATKERLDGMLALGSVSGHLGNSILREVLPVGEKSFRSARQQSPVPFIQRADLTDKISVAVGDIVRREVERGISLAGRDLAGADLRGAKMIGVDLSGAFLEHANLAGADLSGAQCEGAVFSGACLEGASLRGAFFKNANFGEVRAAKADFSGSDMSDANLFKADFTSADLCRVQFGKCNAMKTRFVEARLDDSTCEQGIFLEADLTRATLKQAHWHKAIFINARLDWSNARDANLGECLFADCDAEGCDLSYANLSGMVAVKSRFKGLVATGAHAIRSGWAQCDLADADFSIARLEQANFMKARLDSANFSRAGLGRTMFLQASLRSACLFGVQLYEASLRGADLTGADLRFANLHCTDLENATLDRCDISGSRRIQSILEMPSASPED